MEKTSISKSFSRAGLLGTLLLGLATGACSRPNTIYPADPIAVTDDTPIAIDPVPLPGGFFDQSVNRAAVAPFFDTNDNRYYLRLSTESGLNSISGSFNGAGLGNRALAGVSLYQNWPVDLAANQLVEVRSETNSDFKVLLIADLYCNGSDIRVIEGTPLTSANASFSFFEFRHDEVQWKVAGPNLRDPVTHDIVLSGTGTPGPEKTLEDFIDVFPSSCVSNAYAGHAGLPRSLPTAGVLLSVGDEDHALESKLDVRQWVIDIDSYDTWSNP